MRHTRDGIHTQELACVVDDNDVYVVFIVFRSIYNSEIYVNPNVGSKLCKVSSFSYNILECLYSELYGSCDNDSHAHLPTDVDTAQTLGLMARFNGKVSRHHISPFASHVYFYVQTCMLFHLFQLAGGND